MDTLKDTTMQHVTDVTIVPEATAEFIAGLLERIERLESDLATAEQDSRQKQARIERLEEEECKQAALLDCLSEWKELAKSAEKELESWKGLAKQFSNEADALRAKIAGLVPIGLLHVGSYYGEELQDWEFEADQQVCDRLNEAHFQREATLNLYALPGAKGE